MSTKTHPRRRTGHKQALLEGALQCLQEAGYAHTTARDVVAASGTNLGSIVYHYGSMERLLNTALLTGFERWTQELARALAGAEGQEDFLRVLARELPATFERNRGLVRALFEANAQASSSEEVRRGLVQDFERGRELVLELFSPFLPEPPSDRVIASLLLALFDGLLLQWLIDPDHAPSADELSSVAATISAIGAE
jgi:AcrR family transcriptional regulator